MRNALEGAMDWFFGRGEHAVTVPSMDGVLRPNARLEEAAVEVSGQVPDDLACAGGSLFYTSGHDLLRVGPKGGSTELVRRLERPVTALTALRDGSLVAALSDGRIVHVRDGGDHIVTAARDAGLGCVTAMAEEEPGVLVIANGSATQDAVGWAADLMGRQSTGSLWRLSLADQTITKIAGGLAFPAGVLVSGENIVVSEAWAHRLLAIPHKGGKPVPVLAHLPGYPGRLTADQDGGSWLCIFAPRSQLVEFVLRERRYCERMMRDVPRDYWIAPAYSSGRSFLEPLQGGAVKQLGILKPWAPTRSYGLVVRLDAAFMPTRSLHSRADGTRHGITAAAVDSTGRLLVASRGGGVILDCGRQD